MKQEVRCPYCNRKAANWVIGIANFVCQRCGKEFTFAAGAQSVIDKLEPLCYTVGKAV